jgi:PilZ domain-containing protein
MAVKKDIRRSLRKPSGQRVELGWSGEHGDPVGISGICKNVSEGGMCVVVRDAPPMRAYVQFRLVGLGFAGSASVRSVRGVAAGYEVGLEFAGNLRWE